MLPTLQNMANVRGTEITYFPGSKVAGSAYGAVNIPLYLNVAAAQAHDAKQLVMSPVCQFRPGIP
jgi:hypothetical protein